MTDARYCVEYAKSGRSSCKKCKQQIEKGVGRIGKISSNPFSDDGGDMKVWYHMRCMFETLKKARATTKKIETPADLDGFVEMRDEEKDEIKSLIKEFVSSKSPAKPKKKTKKVEEAREGGGKKFLLAAAAAGSSSSCTSINLPTSSTSSATPLAPAAPSKPGEEEDITGYAEVACVPDNSFHCFCKLCGRLEKEPGYNAKTKIISDYIKFGSSGDGFKGDVYLLVKLLLPTSGKKRVYNLQSKQIVKLLSQVFGCSVNDMVEDLEKGDVAETAKTFFEDSDVNPPAKSSKLSLADVDTFLDRLTTVTKEDDQREELAKIIRRCTSQDLLMIIRLIKHDLRINAGAKHVLDALDPNAYAAFQASNDLRDVVDRVMEVGMPSGSAGRSSMKKLSVKANILTPVKPMLAEACRSVSKAMKKCPHGMYAEIKYDGERVQVHKQGEKFEYFSRSLKAVQPHKVEHIKDYLTKACPHGDSMILDCEILMVDTVTGNPLPFGTLGIHKKTAFKDACCCLFIFDIIYFNGETLMERPICERRKLLEKNVKEVKNKIMLSEQTLIKHEDDHSLSVLIMQVIRQGLEGLVLKDTKSLYEPGKRHWLKVKKDYLEGGAMADTADLIVLGGYYGTGSKGGMMSVFLMGVFDSKSGKFCTVAKCGNGHDDATLTRLQKELDMVKISKDSSKVPPWLLVHKTLVPDLVVKDPKVAPVWEIMGAEFSSSNCHTAGGISIRFPRVTRIRDDKEWSDATDLQQLKELFKTSKETADFTMSAQDGKDEGNVNDIKTEKIEDDESEMEEDKEQLHTTLSSPKPKRKRKAECIAKEVMSPTKRKRKAEAVSIKAVSPQKQRKKKAVETRCAGVRIKEPLADIFTGISVYLLHGTTKADELRKYFIAYDGEVMEEHQKSMATYIVTDKNQLSLSEDNQAGADTKLVKTDWIWDSLGQRQQLPVDDYLI